MPPSALPAHKDPIDPAGAVGTPVAHTAAVEAGLISLDFSELTEPLLTVPVA